MRVLIVEDNDAIREQIATELKNANFVVDLAADGKEGLHLALEYPIDIAVIDIGLPELNGIELIQKIREKGLDYPILILTARDRWQQKVEGLEVGADDYLVKPYHFEELIARLKGLLRRTNRWTKSELDCGAITLDTSSQRVFLKGKEVPLTAFEYKVLEHLILHAGEVISKAQLTESLYAEDADRDSNVIEVFIRRLRAKLDPDGLLKPIETLRGRGYRFTLERQTATEE